MRQGLARCWKRQRITTVNSGTWRIIAARRFCLAAVWNAR